MSVELYDYQESALANLKCGSVLCGKVGSGKSLTGLFFYKRNFSDLPLYIITTAKKRDDKEWEADLDILGLTAKVDSWNNVQKYVGISDAFFIFDEQRAVGTGSWGMSFVKIGRKNKWIMLTATPADVWMDMCTIFLANNFYRNKTEFINEHVEYQPFSNFPKIKRYHNIPKLEKFRKRVIVPMRDNRTTEIHRAYVNMDYDKELVLSVTKERFNPFTGEPIQSTSEFGHVIRRIVNTSERRIANAKEQIGCRDRIIVFYNYNYELEILKKICDELGREYFQWNGSKHERLPDQKKWVYLVQYIAGAEGWNCIKTDTILFYSLNYAYRIMDQAEGRINRINTTYKHLYYIYLKSPDSIDDGILRAIRSKGNFNERNWCLENGFGT